MDAVTGDAAEGKGLLGADADQHGVPPMPMLDILIRLPCQRKSIAGGEKSYDLSALRSREVELTGLFGRVLHKAVARFGHFLCQARGGTS